MNITHDTDFEGLDIAMLALMAAEDVQGQPVLIDGLQQLRLLRTAIRPYVTASDIKERRQQLLHGCRKLWVKPGDVLFRPAFQGFLQFPGDLKKVLGPDTAGTAFNLIHRLGGILIAPVFDVAIEAF